MRNRAFIIRTEQIVSVKNASDNPRRVGAFHFQASRDAVG